jgi:hypothetical protein
VKQFVRELPEPLLTFKYFSYFIAAARVSRTWTTAQVN